MIESLLELVLPWIHDAGQEEESNCSLSNHARSNYTRNISLRYDLRPLGTQNTPFLVRSLSSDTRMTWCWPICTKFSLRALMPFDIMPLCDVDIRTVLRNRYNLLSVRYVTGPEPLHSPANRRENCKTRRSMLCNFTWWSTSANGDSKKIVRQRPAEPVWRWNGALRPSENVPAHTQKHIVSHNYFVRRCLSHSRSMHTLFF